MDQPDDTQVQAVAATLDAIPRAAELSRRLANLPMGRSLAAALATPVTEPADEEIIEATWAFQWFLDRAADGGLPLTSAGYLRPDDVLGAAAVVPAAAGWIGAKNREIQTVPVLVFRECLQHLELLRRHKGSLLPTTRGTGARVHPRQLWAVLRESLVPADGFVRDASVLVLALAADPRQPGSSFDDVAACLDELGYRHGDGSPVGHRELIELDVTTVLDNLGRPARRTRGQWHPSAAALARAALSMRSTP
ncbi:hypothetical protein TEK04_20440 [Klenkia sp. LSe6-5]|uniref:Uncharacterized protein n=1 Tax=Klenkia sesuvii TaxID=3103137 RepID=A0ABU8DZ42_9ACTN